MFYVYVLKSKLDNSFYIGYTANLKKRFEDHNAGKPKYTKSKRPWTLLYYEAYTTEHLARKREINLKKNSKAKKDLLVKIMSPSSSG